MPSPTSDRTHPLDAGFQHEIAGQLERAVSSYEEALAAEALPGARAEVQLRLARVHRAASRWDEALAAARSAAELALSAGEPDRAAEAMNAEVGVHQLRGDFDAGDALAVRALALAVAPRVRGMLLQNRGAIAAQRRDFAAAESLFAESVRQFSAVCYDHGMAVALTNAAAAARDGGNPLRAVALGRQAVAIARGLNALDLLGLALMNQAHALADAGDPRSAEDLLGEAYGHFASTSNVLRQAECLEVIGAMSALGRDDETAARCFTRAHAFAARVGAASLSGRVAEQLRRMGRVAGAGLTPVAA
jgi:tetratricopeptide (TPR) repeat protein